MNSPAAKYLSILLLLLISILLVGYLLIRASLVDITFTGFYNLTLSFGIASLVSLIIFFRGQKRKEDEQAIYSLAALGVKFLASIGIAVTWFAAGKKTSAGCILIFLFLYLTFSLYLIIVIFKTLRSKSL